MELLLKLALTGSTTENFQIETTLNENDANNEWLMNYIGNINKNKFEDDGEENEFRSFIMKQLEPNFVDYYRYAYKILEKQLDDSEEDQQKLIVNIKIKAEKLKPVFRCLVPLGKKKQLNYDIDISDEIIKDVIQKTKSSNFNVNSKTKDWPWKDIYDEIKQSVASRCPNDNSKNTYSIG